MKKVKAVTFESHLVKTKFRFVKRGVHTLESFLNLVKENYSNYCNENENWKIDTINSLKTLSQKTDEVELFENGLINLNPYGWYGFAKEMKQSNNN
jgi:hypothetical protein